MASNKQIIFPNAGLASTPQPDVIQDSQASDILNLRFDKLGYMVNRNGVRALNFVEAITLTAPFLTNNVRGAVGIGEYILSDPVTDSVTFNYDASRQGQINIADHTGPALPYTKFDRFMVFALRTEGNNIVYYLLPNTPVPDATNNIRVSITAANNDVVFFVRQEKADGQPGVTCVAPSRRLVRSADDKWVDAATGAIDDLNWIDHYQSMAQYNDALIICDRINGDAIIKDTWDEAETGEAKVHHLRFQENTKAFFDVDTVRLDFRLASGEENYGGVMNGMALYKFYLQKKQAWYTQDNYNPGIYEGKVGQQVADVSMHSHGLLTQDTADLSFVGKYKDFREAMYNGVDLSVRKEGGPYQGGTVKGVFRDTETQTYSFSDYKQPTEIDSLLDPVSFTDPKLERQYDDKGNLINNNAADVFIWNDLQIRYYPCSGKDHDEIFLRGIDREFAKKDSINPKVVTLKTRAGIEQNLPLGVYAYRFVWDMGNGEYSAPSTPLLVPDKLWSATRDSYTIPRITKYDHNEYDAHHLGSTSFVGLNEDVGDPGKSSNFFPLVYQDASMLTQYGSIFQQVKKAIYAADHALGGYKTDGDLAALVTVYHNAAERELEGVALSGYYFEAHEQELKLMHHHLGKINVPLVPAAGRTHTYNSLFTPTTTSPTYGGYYRRAYTDPYYNYQATRNEFVFQGEATPFSVGVGNSATQTADFDPIRYETDIYYNMVCHKDEGNNGTITHPEYRWATCLRYVNDEAKRLSYFLSSASVEATSRLVAQGIAEFRLTDYTDPIICRAQRFGAPEYDGSIDASVDHLDYNKERTIHNYKSHPDDGIMIMVDSTYKDGSGKTILDKQFGFGSTNDLDSGWFGLNDMYDFICSSPTTDQNWVTSSGIDPGNPRRWFETKNCRVSLHLPGERLLLPEQLTAYFPSSLLFNCPRVMLKIEPKDIPTRAKRLMIFRTLASHDNAWQPDTFGLVDTVDVTAGEPITYFDKKKDTEVDFTLNPNDFDGLIHPLKSRFVLPLNERVYYGRFTETYQPYAPRAVVVNEYQTNVASGTTVYSPKSDQPGALTPRAGSQWSFAAGWKEWKVPDNGGYRNLGYTDMFWDKEVTYFFAFKDKTGEYSSLKGFPGVGPGTAKPEPSHFIVSDWRGTVSGTLGAIGFFLTGYPYIGGIETCELYRSLNGTDYYKIGEIKAEDEGTFVDNGLPNLSKWGTMNPLALDEPYSPPKVEDYISSVRWSEIYEPSNIKLESVESFLIGDGDGITGLAPIDGSLLVFKETSMIRAMTGGGTEIQRRDIVSNQYGCIAPNTIVPYNEHIYFLSWFGLMKYDNNQLVKADGQFAYELDRRLRQEINGVRDPAIRDASCTLNPIYKELYLNIPTAPDNTYDIENKGTKGHIYVINLETNLVTKFGYETGDKEIFEKGENTNTTRGTWARTQGRIYHANRDGQLWSADILARTGDVTSLVYREAPTDQATDEYQPGIKTNGSQETVSQILRSLIQTWWRSKKFNFGDTSNIKRVWKVYAEVPQGTNIRITMEADNGEYREDERSGGGYNATGKLEFIPPFEEGADRGEGVTFELASKGQTEMQNMTIIWKVPNSYYR